MKKLLPIAAVLCVAMLVWTAVTQHNDVHVMFNGHELDSPFDFLVGLFAAGAGMAISVVVMLLVACLLVLVFAGLLAGLGAVVIGPLAVAALVLAVVVSPLLLLALVPIWLVRKVIKQDEARQAAQLARAQ